MNTSFFAYFQQLEIMAFFSGYPLIYAIAVSIAGNHQPKTIFKNRLVFLLPLTYALVGTLYIGLQLKNLYPDYSIENIKLTMQQPFLNIWGVISVFFWLPLLRKKPVISLLHSLVFFCLLIKDIYLQLSSASDARYDLKNVMKVYTDSLLLNISALAGIVIIYSLIAWFRKNKKPLSAS